MGYALRLPSVPFLVSQFLSEAWFPCVWALLVLGIFSRAHEVRTLLD